jgi:hypothetical protein
MRPLIVFGRYGVFEHDGPNREEALGSALDSKVENTVELMK